MAPGTATRPKILLSILNLPSVTFCVEIMSQFPRRLPRLHRFALQGLGFILLVTGCDYAQCGGGLLLRIGERSSTAFDENESDPEIPIQRPVLDRLGQMLRSEIVIAGKNGDRPGELENPNNSPLGGNPF
jgi:hypothetical protein